MAGEMMRPEGQREVGNLRDEMERMLRQAFGGQVDEAALAPGWSPPLDVEETRDTFQVHLEAPGVKPDDIEITFDEGVLSIAGERRFYEDKDEEGFRRIERRYGRFQRTLRLPTPVDVENIEATYADGMLSVTIPKAESTKPRKIQIKGS